MTTTTVDRWTRVPNRSGTTAPAPDLMAVFRSQPATTATWLPGLTPSSHDRTQLMRELAQLSRVPGSLDRDSEIDIWRFDTSE